MNHLILFLKHQLISVNPDFNSGLKKSENYYKSEKH
jgi:hypothetical protein